jgi:DNA repair exonuclease SbcCD ATPase subunit
MADDLDWLRERFQNPVLDQPYVNGNILNFRRAQPAGDQSATVLELVDQAAEVITGIEDNARQIEARAQFLVRSALEKIHLLEGQIESAAQQLSVAQSRLATAEAQVANAEQRGERAEARGRELEHALSRIEDAIRKRLLGMGVGGKTAAAA